LISAIGVNRITDDVVEMDSAKSTELLLDALDVDQSIIDAVLFVRAKERGVVEDPWDGAYEESLS
jgi:hypothetical protein